MDSVASTTRDFSNRVVVGPVDIPRLVGRTPVDEGTLRLAGASACIARQVLDASGDVVYTVIIDEALGRRALMDLLYAVAPYKAHGADRFARVLDNWAIHDRAKSGGGSLSLVQQHAEALKQSWQVFAEHRDLFTAIFADQTESTRAAPVLTWQRTPEGTRRWHFEDLDASLREALAPSVPILRDISDGTHFDALVGLVTLPYFYPEVRKNWPAWQPLVKNGKSNYIGPASVPVISHMHRRALLNTPLIKNVEDLIGSA